ncbi:MAG: Mth938-like domain-containing protein [Micromonosporaceae bacterium]
MGTPDGTGPRISSVRWGLTVIEGVGEFKDAKLWPGGARAWDWTETGTRHVPGVQPGDVQELLDAGAEVLVISRGMDLQLQTSPDTLELLESLGMTVYVEETTQAVKRYNQLISSRRVGALIHSTC